MQADHQRWQLDHSRTVKEGRQGGILAPERVVPVAAEMQARPCHQTMERQTDKREELYAEWAVYGKAFPANGAPFAIGDNQLIDGKLRAVVSLLSHSRCRGALGIRAEHIKA